jgi:heme/copper-type cytochrome/quinol oxidase subunit 2
MPPVHTAEGDAFALTMIIVLFSAFAVVALILFTIFRNAARRSRDLDESSVDSSHEEGGDKE